MNQTEGLSRRKTGNEYVMQIGANFPQSSTKDNAPFDILPPRRLTRSPFPAYIP
jgi:hypothetical protein